MQRCKPWGLVLTSKTNFYRFALAFWSGLRDPCLDEINEHNICCSFLVRKSCTIWLKPCQNTPVYWLTNWCAEQYFQALVASLSHTRFILLQNHWVASVHQYDWGICPSYSTAPQKSSYGFQGNAVSLASRSGSVWMTNVYNSPSLLCTLTV